MIVVFDEVISEDDKTAVKEADIQLFTMKEIEVD